MKTAKNLTLLIYATLTLSVVLMANSVCQAGLQEGVAAYNNGDYITALKEFRILAEKGVAEAQYGLGIMYSRGEGVLKIFLYIHNISCPVTLFSPYFQRHTAIFWERREFWLTSCLLRIIGP